LLEGDAGGVGLFYPFQRTHQAVTGPVALSGSDVMLGAFQRMRREK
jgi:hypothetical protein